MDVQHVYVKCYVENPAQIELTDYLTIFNEWIRDQACEELLVDVADYRHMYAGPAVVLVGHEASYVMDTTDNRLGLLYTRKSIMEGDTQEVIQTAILAAIRACRRLEDHPAQKGKLSFRGDEILIGVNDRLVAPNTEETYQAFIPALQTALEGIFGEGAYAFERYSKDPRRRFAVRVLADHPVGLTAVPEAFR